MDVQICRKCGSREIYSREVNSGGYVSRLLPLGVFSEKKFHMFVCANCGLVEWFVPKRLLPNVIKNFERLR
jgi:predicted nucleic-acid-binding Zn-ribbon protein